VAEIVSLARTPAAGNVESPMLRRRVASAQPLPEAAWW
jgi:hypothetical protein